MIKSNITEDDFHSEDLQEIITKPPSWLLKRGISLVFGVVLMIIGLTVIIKFPEIVTSSMKFNSLSAPKIIMTRTNGNLVKILARDGDYVKPGTELAYIESTADHKQVSLLLHRIQELRNKQNTIYDIENLIDPRNLNLGELQESYQNFYLAYLNFLSANRDGIYQKRKDALKQEKVNLKHQYEKASKSFDLQVKQLKLTEQEFEKYKLLAEKKVISPSELQEKEVLLLAKRQTIPQMENSLINYESNILAKDKEIADLDNQIIEERKKFVQSLNSFISEAEAWKRQYILTSPVSGKLVYGSFLQENQHVKINESLFYVNPSIEQYYGEVLLPQNVSAKVKIGQKVLIKLPSYPFEEFGYLHGKVSYISDIPIRDSVFYTKIEIVRTKEDSLIKLKPGLFAEARILTDDKTIFNRIWNNLTKNLSFNN
ncbi:MAG: HlyD family secretion protein [Sphingobacterium sp.]|jgi:HlyD family secretion protein|nr:HlyD family secretion protein [Sphingobacterium sp.]